MKLNIVPARTGLTWVRLGCQAFFRQPLALSGLVFLYTAAVLLLLQIPVAGLLAFLFVPAATLGIMVATQEAVDGRFPMPTVLVSAFRVGRQRAGAMLILGAIYAAAWLLITLVLVPLLVDVPAPPPAGAGPETMVSPQYLTMMAVTMLLQLPVALVFWFAPGLVHWHGISPVKSLFFSLVACVRNLRALIVFGFGWVVLLLAASVIISIVGALAGPAAASVLMLPLGFMLQAMVSTSIYFPFCDSFVATPGDSPAGDTTDTTTPPGDHA
jgi:hypothetical protein